MKTLGIIVGTNDQPISNKYYLKHKTKFECLKDLLDDLNYIPIKVLNECSGRM